MSTELSAQLSDLSLSTSPSSSSSPSSDSALPTLFKLKCADGQTIEVSPGLLAGISGVFRDMLEMGSGEGECEISETKDEFEMLLDTIRDGQGELDEPQWLMLYRLADKYDVPAAKGFLLLSGWRNYELSPVRGYAIAALLEDRDLACRSAQRTLSYSNYIGLIWSALPQPEKSRLENYRNAYFGCVRQVLNDIDFYTSCSCSKGRNRRNTPLGIWQTATQQAQHRYRPKDDFGAMMRVEVELRWHRLDCRDCLGTLKMKLNELARKWSRLAEPSLY
ncbi:hypothetical protein JCM8097_009319 [Rhodosporidiobolus ruineniae]